MAYHKIVQIGAAGNVGTPVLRALMASGKFDITVVARHTSTFTAPNPSVKVVKVDFHDREALANALRGNDAAAITMGGMADLEQNSKLIINAAIEAGVKRIIPSEFGSDIFNSPGRDEVVFAAKHRIDEYLVQKAAEGAIEYTAIATGPFFDFVLTREFAGFDTQKKKGIIYSGGNSPFNTTTLATIGASVAAVLSNPSEFKNKHLRISDFYVSQNEILDILEDEIGSKFSVANVDAEKQKEDTTRALANGEWTAENILGSIMAAVFRVSSVARWGPEDDTKSLGIPKKDLREEIKKYCGDDGVTLPEYRRA